MKIFLIGSRSGLKKYRKRYELVLKELKEQRAEVKATFNLTYLDSYPKLKKVKDLSILGGKYKHIHDSIVRESILNSNGVVIEASYPSYRLGFETFYTLSQQKPVLVLSKTRDYSKLVDQPNFFGAKYTNFTLPDEVEKFLKHVKEHKLRTRFNLFISETHKQHIKRKAKKYGVSMSDYIRMLIDKEIQG